MPTKSEPHETIVNGDGLGRSMNRLGLILTTLAIVGSSAAAYLYFGGHVPGCEAQQDGTTLHLVRLGTDTVRARFCYSKDCHLIADQMNKVESTRWRCE